MARGALEGEDCGRRSLADVVGSACTDVAVICPVTGVAGMSGSYDENSQQAK